MDGQTAFVIGMALKPFALVLGLCVLASIRIFISRYLPDSKAKRLLLTRV